MMRRLPCAICAISAVWFSQTTHTANTAHCGERVPTFGRPPLAHGCEPCVQARTPGARQEHGLFLPRAYAFENALGCHSATCPLDGCAAHGGFRLLSDLPLSYRK